MHPWFIPLVNEDLFDFSPVVSRNLTFKVPSDVLDEIGEKSTQMRLRMTSNVETDIAVKITYNPLIINIKTGTLLAAFILLLFYALLVWEVSCVNLKLFRKLYKTYIYHDAFYRSSKEPLWQLCVPHCPLRFWPVLTTVPTWKRLSNIWIWNC